MLRRVSALLGCACLALACARATPPSGRQVDGEPPPVPFETLLQTGSSCHGPEREEAVLREAGAWRAWWSVSSCQAGPAPPVDFSELMVLGVRDREGPSGCYAASIVEVREALGGGYRVRVLARVPERGQACTMVVVHPAAAVAVPILRGPVHFEWETRSARAPIEALP